MKLKLSLGFPFKLCEVIMVVNTFPILLNILWLLMAFFIKALLRLSFMIQFKAKTPNNILLIPTLAFTPYVTRPNVLATNLNLNNKRSNVLAIFIISLH